MRRSVATAVVVAVLLIIAGSIYIVGPPLLKGTSGSNGPTETVSVSAGLSTSVQNATSGATAQDWTTYHADNARTGYLPVSNFTTVTAGWTSAALDGDIYAEPLVFRGDVFVATENNSVYALDGSTGSVIWQRNLGPPVASQHAALRGHRPGHRDNRDAGHRPLHRDHLRGGLQRDAPHAVGAERLYGRRRVPRVGDTARVQRHNAAGADRAHTRERDGVHRLRRPCGRLRPVLRMGGRAARQRAWEDGLLPGARDEGGSDLGAFGSGGRPAGERLRHVGQRGFHDDLRPQRQRHQALAHAHGGGILRPHEVGADEPERRGPRLAGSRDCRPQPALPDREGGHRLPPEREQAGRDRRADVLGQRV